MASSEETEEKKQGNSCLPILVLHRICTFFCSHCEPPLLKRSESYLNTLECRRTMKNLCLASRVLRFVAEPILYHRAQFRFEAMICLSCRFVKLSFGFMRNLQERPHLKNHVKVLAVRDFTHNHHDQDIGLDGETLVALELRPLVTGNNAKLIKRLAASVGISCLNSNLSPYNITETFVQLMLLFLPGLTELKVTAQRCWNFRLLSSLTPNKGPQAARAFLSRICKLDLDFSPLYCSCDHCIEFEFEDFIAEKTSWERAAERRLIGTSAASLQTLICSAAALRDAPNLPRLESLSVDLKSDWPNFKTFLGELKCLRRFSFQCSEIEGPVSSEVLGALKSANTSLEMLKIGFRETIRHDLVGIVDDPEKFAVTSTDLRVFTKLKSLSIHAEMICPLYSLDSDSAYWMDDIEDFVRQLPDSLEILYINISDHVETPDRFLIPIIMALTGEGPKTPKGLKTVLCSSSYWCPSGHKIARFKTHTDGLKEVKEWSVGKLPRNAKFHQMDIEVFPDWERLLILEGYWNSGEE